MPHVPGPRARFVLIANEASSLLTLRGELLRDLARRGPTLALAPHSTARVQATLAQWGVALREIPLDRAGLNPLADLRTLWQLLVILRRKRPAAVLACTAKPIVYGLLAAAWCGVPRRVAMYTGLGYAFTDGGGWRRRLVRCAQSLLARIALRHAQAVIFQNRDDQLEFCRRGLVAPERTLLTDGSGVDLARFPCVPLPPGPPVFLFVARLIRDKGIGEFVAAARLVKAEHPEARFVVVGPLDRNPAGISLADLQQWMAEGLVEWLGAVEDVRPLLAASTVFVLPSYREGIPRSILEALSTGRPVITTDAPGCRETVVPGLNGFLVPVRDHQALAEAMRRCLADRAACERMGAASRRLAEQRFDVRRVNARVLAALLSSGAQRLPAERADHGQIIVSARQAGAGRTAAPHLMIIANQAASAVNFRGPFIAHAVKHGWRITLTVPEHTLTPPLRRAIAALGAACLTYPLQRAGLDIRRDLRSCRRLLRLLRRERPDAVLCFAAKPVIYGTWAAWLAGVRRRVALIEGLGSVFTDGPGGPTPLQRLLRPCVWLLYRLALRHAQATGFLNRDDRQEFVARRIVSPPRALLLGPIGVPLDEWPPLPPHLQPITFTFVARLLRDKGVYEFIAAARLVRRQCPDCRFLLLGARDENPTSVSARELQQWVDEGLVIAPGHVPVKPWLAETSVFVLPSYYREGVPRSTQEAMACARPVITTDVPGCRETVIHGYNGILIPPRDAEALAAAMQRFIDQPEHIIIMGNNSRRFAERKFNATTFNCRLELLMHQPV